MSIPNRGPAKAAARIRTDPAAAEALRYFAGNGKMIDAASIRMVAVSMSCRCGAQWAEHSMKNVLRTPDGKADLEAPPRRMADGL